MIISGETADGSIRQGLSLDKRRLGTESDDLMAISPCPDEPLRRGIRRVLQNQWLMAVVILVTAMAMRWGFHLYNPRPTGFFIYHGSRDKVKRRGDQPRLNKLLCRRIPPLHAA